MPIDPAIGPEGILVLIVLRQGRLQTICYFQGVTPNTLRLAKRRAKAILKTTPDWDSTKDQLRIMLCMDPEAYSSANLLPEEEVQQWIKKPKTS